MDTGKQAGVRRRVPCACAAVGSVVLYGAAPAATQTEATAPAPEAVLRLIPWLPHITASERESRRAASCTSALSLAEPRRHVHTRGTRRFGPGFPLPEMRSHATGARSTARRDSRNTCADPRRVAYAILALQATQGNTDGEKLASTSRHARFADTANDGRPGSNGGSAGEATF